MPCRTCKRECKDTTHGLCRRHAFCGFSDGRLYYGAPCFIYQDLWERSQDQENPSDARTEWESLYGWVVAFCRNSRNRQPGQDFFEALAERELFEHLQARMAVPPSSATPSGLLRRGQLLSLHLKILIWVFIVLENLFLRVFVLIFNIVAILILLYYCIYTVYA